MEEGLHLCPPFRFAIRKRGRQERIEELIAPDCVLRAEGTMLRDPAEIRRGTEDIRAAFSDFDLRITRSRAGRLGLQPLVRSHVVVKAAGRGR